ncbi:MAG TPA: hypothetical protein VIH71_04880 [Solirubrobacteraceae bacterium]
MNVARVSGGGAPAASVTLTSQVSDTPAGFEFTRHDATVADATGASFAQAGGHPYQFNTSFELSFVHPQGGSPGPAANLKEATVTLPHGMVVNPQATPERCTETEFETPKGGPEGEVSSCPAGSAVGVVYPTLGLFESPVQSISTPLYNLVPPPGVPAEFGFNPSGFGIYVHLLGHVDSAGDFVLSASARDVPTFGSTSGFAAELWGDPGDPSHVYRRGECAYSGKLYGQECPVADTGVPFLTMPSECGKPLSTGLTATAWQAAEPISSTVDVEDEAGNPVELEGCNQLQFKPTITAQPTTSLSDSPTGLRFDLHQPQDENLEDRGTAPLKDARVTLPEGVTVNASAANGLGSCDESQIGYQPAEGKIRFSEAPQSCPDSAKIGTLEVSTPLLAHKLPGSIYLAKPYQNPFGSLLAIYLAVEDEETGIIAKLAGKVEPDPQTGQLTATFTENPELPLEDISLQFFEGPGAALTSPLACGEYSTATDLTPWSTPEGADAHPSDSFQTTTAASGSGQCPSSEADAPNAPTFSAGTVEPQAGSFSPFVLKLSRADGTQRITGIDTTLPAGLTGKLAGIPYCSEEDIALAKSREVPQHGQEEQASPSCPQASEVGTIQVTAGAGAEPTPVSGHVYLAGSYRGAPLSLVVVVPAVAGPFDLGDVVTRVALYIDEHTARIHAVSDSLPTILDGVPLDIRSIELKLDRSGFILNPTSCDPSAIEGSVTTAAGQVVPLTNRFQVGGCTGLKFAPQISFSTNGKTSKQNGADLITKVTYPSAPQGTYANVGYFKVELPEALPSRITTLQKACLAKVFEANPAACPPEATIGHATVHTPLLPVPLTGPAIFVSHGGEAFPSLTMVLQGYGITIDLVGTTFISKAGITSTTLKAVPDTPFSEFELVLPQGPYSALTANGNLCDQKLVFPNEFVSQAGGAPVKQDSTATVTGCAPAITVVGHRVKGKTATIQVKVPSAGKLAASGKGLSKVSRKAKGATTLTVKLTLTKREAAALSKHKGRKLKAKINLTFTPATGGKLKNSTTVMVG